MDAIELLLKEHEIHRKLLLEVDSDLGIFPLLRQEVIHHINMEEEVFYPNLLTVKVLEAPVKEAWEEHSILMHLIQEMDELLPRSSDWNAKFEVFKKIMLTHLEEEEVNLFPKIKSLAPVGFLLTVADKMLNHKKKTDPEEIIYPTETSDPGTMPEV